jgi:hypothetical protein
MWKLAKAVSPDIVCTEHSRVDHGTERRVRARRLHLHTRYDLIVSEDLYISDILMVSSLETAFHPALLFLIIHSAFRAPLSVHKVE